MHSCGKKTDFYKTYLNLREVKAPLTTTTQLKGTITYATTNAPIKGATITVVEQNKTAVTDSTGEYSIKPIEHGKFTVRIEKNGYQPYENDEIEIKIGDILHLDVELNS